MRVYDLHDPAGVLTAFEIPAIGRQRVQRFVATLPGAKVLRRQRRFQIGQEEHFCEFEFDGRRFVIWEPWNDSSRFWIGEDQPQTSAQLERLREMFAGFKMFWLW